MKTPTAATAATAVTPITARKTPVFSYTYSSLLRLLRLLRQWSGTVRPDHGLGAAGVTVFGT
jgi:hypothetical protein